MIKSVGKVIFFVLIVFGVFACSKNNEQLDNVIIDASDDMGALTEFLKGLPKKESINSQTPYVEISMFLRVTGVG